MSSLHATYWFTPVYSFWHVRTLPLLNLVSRLKTSIQPWGIHPTWSVLKSSAHRTWTRVLLKGNTAYSETEPFRSPIRKLTQFMLLNFNDWSISHSSTLLSHRIKVCGTTHPSILLWGRIPHAVHDHTRHFTRRPLVVFIQPGPRFNLVLRSPLSTFHATFIAYLS